MRFLGIDSSTQGCKIVCINVKTREVEYIDSVIYDTDLPQYETLNGVIRNDDALLSEANPQMWLDAVNMLFSRLKKAHYPINEILAVSVSGQQHGLVALDKEGNLIRNRAKLWNDFSTSEECEILTGALGGKEACILEIGNTFRPGYTAGKILHLYRHEPETAAKSATFFLVHNYINWFLTGGKNGGIRVMEPGDVSGMALSFPGSESWSERVCNAIAPDLKDKLPPVRPADEMIGKISRDLVSQYGFSPGCLVDAGCGDNMYSAVGTGNIKPGIVTISLGTSGTAYTILDKPYVDPDGEIASFCDSTGKFMPLLCVANMANGYNELLEIYNIDHGEFAELLKQTNPGNDGRLLFPWYVGERTPDLPKAAPVYWGFGLRDFTKPVLCRAVLEGHILNLYNGFRKMPVKPKEIRLTGGLSKSDAWCSTIADIFGAETVPVQGEGAALGAAVHSAWVYFKNSNGEYSLEEIADIFVKIDNSRRKFPRNQDVYNKIRQSYEEISRRLRTGNGKSDPFYDLSELSKKG